MDLFCILIVSIVLLICTCVKIHRPVHQKSPLYYMPIYKIKQNERKKSKWEEYKVQEKNYEVGMLFLIYNTVIIKLTECY